VNDLKEVVDLLKKLVKDETGKDFPKIPLNNWKTPATPFSAVGTTPAPSPTAD
jgi:hypothetical protein